MIFNVKHYTWSRTMGQLEPLSVQNLFPCVLRMTWSGRFLCRYKSPPSFVACHSSTFVNSCRWQVTILSTQGKGGEQLTSVCDPSSLLSSVHVQVLSSIFRNYFQTSFCSFIFTQAKTNFVSREAVCNPSSLPFFCPQLTFIFWPAVIETVV